MTRYLDLTPLAEIGNLLISISATFILIAGAVTAVRFYRVAARRLPARTHNGRSAELPDADRPYFSRSNCRCTVVFAGATWTDSWISEDPPQWDWPSRRLYFPTALNREISRLTGSAR